MVQKPLKKVKITKKPTKYFKRSNKDKSVDFLISKEINKKNLQNVIALSNRNRKNK
ncbi:hypothetical protein AAJ76_4200015539 [Vairimorpha ceranae]|uniref:Uncharacterized protein n=1 Tax=Vairimorpha ceranae TaxID=40302 RepID=A0A0F9WPH9_9MICR|nr:hypothetical protein AAJ76_4200015539 [Vairimorpha ceranae]KKO74848.1 hypothetical protein AAJ76_4200015539 [Vairimorpha ceranae]